jgi:ribose transport system permease protein
MLIQLIDQSIITLGINQNYNQVVIGLAIIIAVVIDRLSSRAATRRLAAIAASHEGPHAAEPADGLEGDNP